MSKPHNPAIDAYLRKAPSFAQPIITHLRELVHATCPEVEEAIKWGVPGFLYRGPLCGVAAFKAHCRITFWKGDVLGQSSDRQKATLSKLDRVSALSDLPSRASVAALIRAAMKLNEAGTLAGWQRTAKAKRDNPRPVKTPPALAAVLKKNPRARKTWEGFALSHRREYADWIDSAKKEETRDRRIQQTLEWLIEGKPRNWKYMPSKT